VTDVLVVGDGVLPLQTATLATIAAPAVRAAWLEAMVLPPEAFDWPLNVLVLRSGDRTILVDSGLGASFQTSPGPGSSLSGWRPPAPDEVLVPVPA
jgi:hypothetical protein